MKPESTIFSPLVTLDVYKRQVAKVAKVTLTPGAATYNLTLIPTADLRHLAYVDVVLWEPST